ncbi:MAG: hypothetical protein M1827_006852 [Pycnora praestabilis]|nr:MAG: hypothetical protein M1827_006852 [Pycnora praestabilis]
MEVDRISFQSQVPTLLTAISKAHFVAFDLELSGILTRQPQASKSAESEGRQTLQQRYEEVKEAAEKYQVLQVGITCVEEDVERGVYIARPYNFNLNPIMEERLDIERIFSFQSGAVEFLLSHGFRMDVPFTKGVPYLSREEEKMARRIGLARLERSTISDIQIQPDDADSLKFLRRVRREVNEWKFRNTREPEFINIAPVGHDAQPNATNGLSNFQKRLVHQLVRAEYPEFVTISRPTFIQIVAFDQTREDSIKRSKIRRLEEQISRQTGLRWLVEAMTGGDLSGIDPGNFARSMAGDPVFIDLGAVRCEFDELRQKLSQRRTVLVGHNLFTDMVNFYRCFLGDLPASVVEFQARLHQLFPMIIDTKYLATHNCGSINPKSSLQEIEEALRPQQVPIIETHHEHSKYQYSGAAHEAGYDSFLTAKVLVRLAAKLEASGTLVREHELETQLSDEDVYHTAPEDSGGVSLSPPVSFKNKTLAATKENRVPNRNTSSGSDSGSDGISLVGRIDEVLTTSQGWKKQPKTSKKGGTKSLFSHATMFDSLLDLPIDDEDVDEPLIVEPPPEKHNMTVMPAFDSDFWSIYGNKLRVFGTAERVCDLNAAPGSVIL